MNVANACTYNRIALTLALRHRLTQAPREICACRMALFFGLWITLHAPVLTLAIGLSGIGLSGAEASH